MAEARQREVVPGAWFLVSILAMVSLHRWAPGQRVIPGPYRYGGVVPILLGLSAGIWALNLCARASTTVRPSKKPTALVTRGPFRFSRHPMYMGMSVALCGVAVLLGSAGPWLVVPLYFVFVARRFAGAEERMMAEVFGEDYRRYSAGVRRWL